MQNRVQANVYRNTLVCIDSYEDGVLDGRLYHPQLHSGEQFHSAIRSMIRDGKNHQIDNAIAAGSSEGMLTMDQSILALYQAGRITRETALNYADNPEQLRRRMGN